MPLLKLGRAALPIHSRKGGRSGGRPSVAEALPGELGLDLRGHERRVHVVDELRVGPLLDDDRLVPVGQAARDAQRQVVRGGAHERAAERDRADGAVVPKRLGFCWCCTAAAVVAQAVAVAGAVTIAIVLLSLLLSLTP